MTVQLLLLRGINVGGHNRLPMARLREIAEGAGFAEVASYVQSGNLVGTSGLSETEAAAALRAAVHEHAGLDVDVLVRTAAQLGRVITANPLGEPADPRLFAVTFLAKPVTDLGLDPDAWGEERVAVHGREIYSWHPAGMHGSRLAPALARAGGRGGTARNWRTVLALREMAGS